MTSFQSRPWLAALPMMFVMLVPSAALAQRTVVVNVDSQPQGAAVRVDSENGAPIGTTPVRRVRLPAGAHTLFFRRDGYLPVHTDVNVTHSRETFTATLTQGGSIYVSADVDGAQIFLDGNAVGVTPGRIDNVVPQQHVVEIRQSGMQPFQQTVTVQPGAVASVSATIRPPTPAAPVTGTVRVLVANPNGPLPPDVSVLLDGIPLAGQPPSSESASVGRHIVQVTASGFRSVTRELDVTSGQNAPIAVVLEAMAPTMGSVRVSIPTTGAQVFLDDVPIVAAPGGPALRDNVPPGPHTVRVTAPGHSPDTRAIQVTAGQVTPVEFGDLPAVVSVGHLAIRSSTPNASVFIDGHNVGPVDYVREDMPAGTYRVGVRAQGFQDGEQTCSVSAQQGCDVNLQLQRAIGTSGLHVELNPPIQGAVLTIDGTAMGEIGEGRDVPNLPATTHNIRVHADGFPDFIQDVTLREGEPLPMVVSLRNRPTRRTATSTWGGSPLARGDVALDVLVRAFGYLAEVRGATGLFEYKAFAMDAGFAIRTVGYMTELEGRTRAGFVFGEGLVGLGVDARVFAGIGSHGQGNYGFNGYLVGSIHSLSARSDLPGSDPGASANRLGSFAFSARIGFEASSDALSGLTLQNHTAPGMTGMSNFVGCDATPASADPCGLVGHTMMNATGDTVITGGSQGLVRPVIGATIEFGLSRNWNIFVGVDRVLVDNSNPANQRIYYQLLWGRANDTFTYLNAGLTYKF